MKLKLLNIDIQVLLFFLLIPISFNVFSKDYEIPPTSTTSSNAPWIPDEDMEMCVKKYNEAKWLSEELSKTNVDKYSQASVNAYNSKVSNHSRMIDYFNEYCAGKQSESAYKAAQKLTAEEANN